MITVSSSPGMDSDWLMGERGNQKGRVPITYLELLNWDPQPPPSHPALCDTCELIFIAHFRNTHHPFYFHSVIDTKRSLGLNKLKLDWINMSDEEKETGPWCVWMQPFFFLFNTMSPRLHTYIYVFHASQPKTCARTSPENTTLNKFLFTFCLRWRLKCF